MLESTLVRLKLSESCNPMGSKFFECTGGMRGSSFDGLINRLSDERRDTRGELEDGDDFAAADIAGYSRDPGIIDVVDIRQWIHLAESDIERADRVCLIRSKEKG